ncbi:hypothetical protein [Methanocorpusculum vombati]|uniref:Uncharacterized protein n=1 Tax=Methanocorpusculum vombati TaxID=3002864 RepID=A0ABT4ILG3_9EURY|nr:hypothetical protein [Methanocorpusculum vombati]MCZ9320436.1 hypothetical protein [Methanocorpusculum sp.]MCZ0862600.1 hypothetical protein [Methanocorpusculum vombati]MDE2520996.1 hypothetical protein [Methanocorpusculum sp.]MDE2533991.1 hypothetical protein [Methanocorpusculum sp.]MDE2548111.1 hypothetical protein [Methanocorpusculum sp.]
MSGQKKGLIEILSLNTGHASTMNRLSISSNATKSAVGRMVQCVYLMRRQTLSFYSEKMEYTKHISGFPDTIKKKDGKIR